VRKFQGVTFFGIIRDKSIQVFWDKNGELDPKPTAPQEQEAAKPSPASKDRIIEGKIAGYECGDNCYLKIIDKNKKGTYCLMYSSRVPILEFTQRNAFVFH
jgi:hypothetical protein